MEGGRGRERALAKVAVTCEVGLEVQTSGICDARSEEGTLPSPLLNPGVLEGLPPEGIVKAST